MELELPMDMTLTVPDGQFRPGTDTVALSVFAAPLRGNIVDLGAGCGALELLLCQRSARVAVTGIELQPEAAHWAEENIRRNHLTDRAQVLCGDLRDPLLHAGVYDGVISNPPYFNTGTRSDLAARRTARAEEACDCVSLVHSAARLLRSGGHFWLLWRPERMVELFYALREAKLEPKRIRAARAKQVRFIMVDAMRDAQPGLRWEPDLILSKEEVPHARMSVSGANAHRQSE